MELNSGLDNAASARLQPLAPRDQVLSDLIWESALAGTPVPLLTDPITPVPNLTGQYPSTYADRPNHTGWYPSTYADRPSHTGWYPSAYADRPDHIGWYLSTYADRANNSATQSPWL